jgi:hypothetical protein
MTIVGGTVIYEEGRCALVDEAAVMAEAQVRGTELIERAGLTGLAPTRQPPAAGSGAGLMVC